MIRTRRSRIAALVTTTLTATVVTMMGSMETASANPTEYREMYFSPAVEKGSGIPSVYAFDNGAWVAMQTSITDTRSQMRRCDLESCFSTDVPDIGHLRFLTGVSNTEVYASSLFGVIRFDDGTWKDMGFPKRENSLIADIKAAGTKDVWVASRNLPHRLGTPSSLLHRWDGSRWREVPGLPDNLRVTSMAASSPQDVWVHGWYERTGEFSKTYKYQLMHWNGLEWSTVVQPDTRDMRSPTIRVTGPGEVWIIGRHLVNDDDTPLLSRLDHDGAGWTNVIPTEPDSQYTTVGDLKRDGSRLIMELRREANLDFIENGYAVSDDGGATWKELTKPLFMGIGSPADAFDIRGGELWIAGRSDQEAKVTHRTI